MNVSDTATAKIAAWTFQEVSGEPGDHVRPGVILLDRDDWEVQFTANGDKVKAKIVTDDGEVAYVGTHHDPSKCAVNANAWLAASTYR